MTTNATVAVSVELAEGIADQLEAQAAKEDDTSSMGQGEGNRLRWAALELRKQIRRAEMERYNAAHAEAPKAQATSARAEVAAYEADIYKAKRNARVAKKGGLR
jgi:hypothetical protein